MVWLIFSSIAVILAFLGQESTTPKTYVIFRGLLVIVLSYFISFGGGVTTDHFAYVDRYLNFSVSDISIGGSFGRDRESSEFGFALLMALGKLLHLGAPGFLFLVSFIINSLYISVIYRFKGPVLAVLILILSFVFFQEANVIRQSLAISVFLYSLKYLNKKDVWKYIIAILIASTFHFSIIICLLFLLYVFKKKKNSNNNTKVFLIVFWLLSILSALNILNLGIERYINGITEWVFYGSDYELTATLNKMEFNILYNFSFILLLLFDGEKQDRVYYLIFALGCIFMNFACNFNIFYRFAFVFAFSFPILLPSLFDPNGYKKSYVPYIRYSKIAVICYEIFILFINGIIKDSFLLGSWFYSLSEFFI